MNHHTTAPLAREAYAIEFEIRGLPKTQNANMRVHWRVLRGQTKKWKALVRTACAGREPSQPLERARLTLIRHSSREPDTDGLIASFKAVVDGLVEAQVIADDRPSNIGIPDYKWAKAKPRDGKIFVKVEAV